MVCLSNIRYIVVASFYVLLLATKEVRRYDMNRPFLYFALVGSIISVLFFIVVNFLTSPEIIWFIHPTFAFILWPLSIYCFGKGKYKLFSSIVSLVLIVYLIVENYINSPEYPWFLYAICPIIWWPILVSLGRYATLFRVSVLGNTLTILYYATLNIVLSPQYPWIIYPIFVVLWWPLSIHYIKTKKHFKFSLTASFLISVFFILVNVISSPKELWAIYPIFLVLWWPLSMYFYHYKRGHD